jgi:hypothetical protein
MPAPMVQHLVYQSTVQEARCHFLQLPLVLKLKNKEIIRQCDDKHASKKRVQKITKLLCSLKVTKKIENLKHNIGTR